MKKINLTKNELKEQRTLLTRLTAYVPTLRLKKALLQEETSEANKKLILAEEKLKEARLKALKYAPLIGLRRGVNYSELIKIKHIDKAIENISGIELPVFKGITFEETVCSFLDTPEWLDEVIVLLKTIVELSATLKIDMERFVVLQEELRIVSLRVNLFEKNLIPSTQENIKKIKIYLQDQALMAIGQIKTAKKKILNRQQQK